MRQSGFIYIVLCAIVLLLLWPFQAIASEEADEENILKDLVPSFDHLLALADYESPSEFDENKITAILDFVAAPKPAKQDYTLGSRGGGSSAYYEFKVGRSLKEVMDLAYNPSIPSHVTSPTSIRRSHWVKIDGNRESFPNLSDGLKDLSSPFIVKAVEFLENTPDATSGAYYAYELDRTMILMQYKGQPVLLSMSNQKNKSDVGRKGLVLGSDEHWNYVYTGEKGCTKKGLSWADSYMYTSSSIMVYYQTSDPVPQVRCGTFKWLKAGWAGINLVQPVHIREGIKRFASTYKALLESPALTDVTKMGRMFNHIEMLSTEDLRKKSRLYFDHLAQRYTKNTKLSNKWLTQISKDDNYIEKMSREEMKAIVSIEYLKYLLGKDQPFDVSSFNPTKSIITKGQG